MTIEETGNLSADETRVDDTAIAAAEPDNDRIETADGIDLEGLDLEADTPDDDTEEVEHDGAKYKVPKALKPLLMFQQDYTRKTMEVAEERRAVAEAKATLEQAQSMTTAEIRAVASLEALGSQLAEFNNVNWAQLDATDPDVQQARWRYDQLQRDYQGQQQSLTQHFNAKTAQTQQESAKRGEELERTLQREIKDWSPAKRDELTTFATSQGYTPEVIAQAEAADFKMLNLARIGAQFIERQKAAAKLKAATTAQPAAEIKGRSPSVRPLDDRASTEAWMKARQATITR